MIHATAVVPEAVSKAADWLLNSGIQEPSGGVARHYRADLGRNSPVSNEITGYQLSTLLYLHSVTGDPQYLVRAHSTGRFLAETAWDAKHELFPFENADGNPSLTYFFDSGIIIRGLLRLGDEYAGIAHRAAHAMARHFDSGDDFHPILQQPDGTPLPRDARWSRSAGCYQLKSALAWHEAARVSGESALMLYWDRALNLALADAPAFLAAAPDRHGAMDRLHAYCYFLEALMAVPEDPRAQAALACGIEETGELLRSIEAEFVRSDVYAQLLRIRLMSGQPVDRAAACHEAEQLMTFQASSDDPRIEHGFWFGRRHGTLVPYTNPASTSFALQALQMWREWKDGRRRWELDSLI